MRVISGTARRLSLEVPEGQFVRPTTDRIKETLFNMISIDVVDADFLDVFSGSGGIGIEALSRGASKAFFVESHHVAQLCIEKNLKHTKLIDKAEIIKYDYSKAFEILARRHEKMDIIFLDPPYLNQFEEKAISLIFELALLKSSGTIICESDVTTSFEFVEAFEQYEVFKEKKFGTNKFTFIRMK